MTYNNMIDSLLGAGAAAAIFGAYTNDLRAQRQFQDAQMNTERQRSIMREAQRRAKERSDPAFAGKTIDVEFEVVSDPPAGHLL